MKGNEDMYKGQGLIWVIAKSHNDQSKILNGAHTARRVRKVKQTKQLPLT